MFDYELLINCIIEHVSAV